MREAGTADERERVVLTKDFDDDDDDDDENVFVSEVAVATAEGKKLF